MVVKKVGAVIWRSNNIKQMLQFYRILGIPLDHDTHEGDEHTRHYEADLEGVHYALFERQKGSADAGSANCDSPMLGFEVTDLLSLVKSLEEIGATFKSGLEETPWGKRVVAYDPDGRPIELYQP